MKKGVRLVSERLIPSAFLVLTLAVACAPAPTEPDPVDLPPAPGLVFRSFEFPDLNGESRSLEDFLDKATLVNFFFPT